MRPDRQVKGTGISLEIAQQRVSIDETVRRFGIEVHPGQSVTPVRRVEREGVPTLRAPGLSDFAAFQYDVVYPAPAE